jgi:nucleotide-binding universal stress UspA family protein
MAEAPILICYDGSEHAKAAIRQAATLLSERSADVLAVWQPATALPTYAWAGVSVGAGIDFTALDQQSQETAQGIAREGVKIAGEAGLDARPETARADGPIWEAIARAAEERGAPVIVLGARGLTGLRNLLLGSVSEGVIRHARRPTLVVH